MTGGYLLEPSQQVIRALSSGWTKKARDWRVLESPAGGSKTLWSWGARSSNNERLSFFPSITVQTCYTIIVFVLHIYGIFNIHGLGILPCNIEDIKSESNLTVQMSKNISHSSCCTITSKLLTSVWYNHLCLGWNLNLRLGETYYGENIIISQFLQLFSLTQTLLSILISFTWQKETIGPSNNDYRCKSNLQKNLNPPLRQTDHWSSAASGQRC